jgi:hypothetical protein
MEPKVSYALLVTVLVGRLSPGREERFLPAQADTFAGANVKRKSVGLLRSK